MKTQKNPVNQLLTETLRERSIRNFRNVFIHVSCMAILLAFCLAGCTTIGDRTYPVNLSVNVVPDYTETNDAISKKIFKLLMATHTTCGLDAGSFHQNIASLQDLVAGTGFESILDAYIVAARLCHDAKIKPSKYKVSDSRAREDVTEITVSPTAKATDVKVGSDGVKLGSVSVSVPISRKKSLSSTEQAMKEIEYAQNVYVTVESLNKLQALEDEYFVYVTKALKSKGYINLTVNDFIGKWLFIEEKGSFTITLKRDMKMEMDIIQDAGLITGAMPVWQGIWRLDGKVLKIAITSITGRGFLGSLIYEKWENNKLTSWEVTYADETQIIVKDKDGGFTEKKLIRQ
jgi:hypothetical protein